jgi:poly-gamma-glutamate synthesis protein (capsule biosynthesis protein)
VVLAIGTRTRASDVTPVSLFLCGDVMTGRGIDQILPSHCDPALHEPWAQSALDYVRLAEERNGPIARPVAPGYVWGDALDELARAAPDARIVNLETAVTRSDDWVDKGINYRMHPDNVACLTAAGIDCCALANNHVLDWGRAGLLETLDTLHAAGIDTAGAGRDRVQARSPAQLPAGSAGRVLVYALGMESSGTPPDWAAQANRAGVDFLADLSEHSVAALAQRIRADQRAGDLVVCSIHWGGNWGYEIPPSEMAFAHRLIDQAGVDLVHGHSSHHPKAIEVYRGKLILYGCGDLINDYEGIHGYESFRGDLGLMFFPALAADSGRLLRLELAPMQMKCLRLQRAVPEDVRWLRERLAREGRRFGTTIDAREDGRLEVRWGAS